ncbi:hypothetical protein KGF56_000885 [Candida oxycetoniae]|uniref:DUF218 domain-containing protein n=1 Tax=Candida oxycetoniae TaxID=497107 RepID=A0AAI9T138_9ASCO|nr:uncharacterized protein KGF56_000885 [Candida oxycetoniae]KAI3406404.2 hypothetical protein KGF56_000885 [Candida oxycetoniae]
MDKPNHLVIVPCHAIWKGRQKLDQNEWYLAEFQLEGNDHLCFIDHIQQAVHQIKRDTRAHLIISGGETKKVAGPIAEATSYYQLLQEIVNNDQQILAKVDIEVFARDSFENVLFSLCRFYELFQIYPDKITIIGFEFKRNRFVHLHLMKALGVAQNDIEFIGNEPKPQGTAKKIASYLQDLEASEQKHAWQLFVKDWYGIGQTLRDKKRKRNPFNRRHNYISTNPLIAEFLKEISDDYNSTKTNEEISSLLKEAPWGIKPATQTFQPPTLNPYIEE